MMLYSFSLAGLRHKCNSNNDCEDGMVCQFENSNRTIGVAKFMSSKTKLCLCDNDNGYVEDILHDICSGGKDLYLPKNIDFLYLNNGSKLHNIKIYKVCFTLHTMEN